MGKATRPRFPTTPRAWIFQSQELRCLKTEKKNSLIPLSFISELMLNIYFINAPKERKKFRVLFLNQITSAVYFHLISLFVCFLITQQRDFLNYLIKKLYRFIFQVAFIFWIFLFMSCSTSLPWITVLKKAVCFIFYNIIWISLNVQNFWKKKGFPKIIELEVMHDFVKIFT